ncbi:MAG: hypothetical protein IJQ65_00480 [Kiritimatiellae bacterium]|nr:hypothetical protein [Kiritimatiellia bacterium]
MTRLNPALPAAFASISLTLASAAGERLVKAPPPAETPAPHVRIPIFGRDYWTWMTDGKYTDPLVWDAHSANNEALRDAPFFRDCALDVSGHGKNPIPEGKGVYPKVASYFDADPAKWERLLKRPKPGKPIMVRAREKRAFRALVGEVDYDKDDLAAFKASVPDFWGFQVCDEWDSDFVTLIPRFLKQKDSPLRSAILAEYGSEQPRSRNEFLAHARKYFERKIALYYGNRGDAVALRSCVHVDHLAAAWGAKHLILETTDTTGIGDFGYRWDVSAMFVRGAARQFHVPWSWYSAIFLNGVRSTDGKQQNESNCTLPPNEGRPSHWGPWGGVSASLQKRCWYFAFASGAASVQPEDWQGHFFDRGPDGREGMVLSRRGQAFSDFHDFASSHPDRGDFYAPVALLVPFNECPSQWGQPWGWHLPFDLRSTSVEAAVCTIIPGTPRAKELQKFGHETAMRNSPRAQMYDVLTPDSPQGEADFLKALQAYPAAVLLGAYDIKPGYSSALVKYVRNGGTLFVNSVQAPGEFDDDFLGLSLGGAAPCGGKALDPTGKTVFSVTDDYEVVTAKLKTARPLLVDDRGQLLAAVNDVGRGRVITTTPRYLVPRDVNPVATATGARKYPFYEWIFSRLQEELFPVKVKGDCLYGLNRTKKGWWLWTFNNRGVGKFADRHETVDHAYDTVVRVDASGLGPFSVREVVGGGRPFVCRGRFSWPVDAGEFAIFEISPEGR